MHGFPRPSTKLTGIWTAKCSGSNTMRNSKGYEITRIFQEQASGINEKRKQLAQLLTLAEQRQIHRVLIEYPDRLARFGYRYLMRYLASYGLK